MKRHHYMHFQADMEGNLIKLETHIQFWAVCDAVFFNYSQEWIQKVGKVWKWKD